MSLTYEKIGVKRDQLVEALRLGCEWLTDIAQVKTERLTIESDTKGHRHRYWRGAIRGESA